MYSTAEYYLHSCRIPCLVVALYRPCQSLKQTQPCTASYRTEGFYETSVKDIHT